MLDTLKAHESSQLSPAMQDKYYANFSRHAGLININTMPTLPRHAGISSDFSRHAGTITKFFPPCEIIFLKGHKCQDWLILNHQI
jgi:hypothetical protein